MSGFFPAIPWFQSASDIPKEGLPFWLFWFLLCVIILLVFFIFLRDKDLRQRMSSFLSGAKRRMIRLRLQARLKKEKAKKAELWKELGKKVWSEDIGFLGVEEVREKLGVLEEERNKEQVRWQEIYARIDELNRGVEEARREHQVRIEEEAARKIPDSEVLTRVEDRKKSLSREAQDTEKARAIAEGQRAAAEKEISSLEEGTKTPAAEKADRLERAKERNRTATARREEIASRLPSIRDELTALDEEAGRVRARLQAADLKIKEAEDGFRHKIAQMEKEIREWEKAKEKVQQKIISIRDQAEPLFQSLGQAADEARLTRPDLALLYFQLDSQNRAIESLQGQIEKLL